MDGGWEIFQLYFESMEFISLRSLRVGNFGLLSTAMTRRSVFIKAILVLTVVWAGVWGVRTYAGSKKITSESLARQMERANFSDWSKREGSPDDAEVRRREQELREIAGMMNRLDFKEREQNRQNRVGETFFRRLSATEKSLFIDLTVMESMNRFMEALDAMPAGQRKKFVEQGLKEIEEGRTEEELARAKELGSDLLEKISQEGMRAYFEKSNAQTKLDLAPLMEAVNETMQGLRGNEFGPRRQQ